ncbi:MAG: 3D domain-containing protein [Candidatus Eremiobacteraeota bacterium]|nr:3D domain-containing protein [Candidatus Eremiobacteraeota bacterium]
MKKSSVLLACILLSALFLVIPARVSVTFAQQPDDEAVVTVEGEVIKEAVQVGSAENVAPMKKNLLEYRKKREKKGYQAPPGAEKKSFSLNVEARSYCLRGFTSRGVYTRMGVIAVDPRIIPYGSKIYIPGFGWGTALDTGGAIVGRSIDIWMPTYSQCMQWGVRNVTVKVVKP